MTLRVNRRERDAILNSLGAGVVPAIGLPHVQVGRKHEVQAVLDDLRRVEEGGSAVRFVVGRFGSGKSFFLSLMRTVALERRFVVLQADVTTERRLYASDGKARALYAELLKNTATRSRPAGGALNALVERWISEVAMEVGEERVAEVLPAKLKPLLELVGGFDFVHVLTRYWEAHLEHDTTVQEQAARWLRGEFATKTEARQELGVRSIVDDDNWYDHLKLFAAFVRIAGYTGLLVNVDELVVLSHRLNNARSRNNNYEKVLQILNDCLQGGVEGLAFLFAGTDDCLRDPRRGLFSYEALRTRLQPNQFASAGLRDLTGPVIELETLSEEERFVLLDKVREVHGGERLPREAIPVYLAHSRKRLGAEYFETPRDTVKGFVGLLRLLEQNPEHSWEEALQVEPGSVAPFPPAPPAEAAEGDDPDDDLTRFTL